MYSHDDFVTDVTKAFEFLESDFGMRREPPRVADGGCWVTYGNADVKVIVEQEIGGYCGVAVQDLKHVKEDPLHRSEFDLDEIVSISSSKPQRRPAPRTMSEAVARAAETLQAIGGPVLKGGFTALHDRQRKVVAAVRKNNPTAV